MQKLELRPGRKLLVVDLMPHYGATHDHIYSKLLFVDNN
jgi:hypothetical protein